MRTAPIGELTESVKTWNPSRDPDSEFDYIDLSAVDNASKSVTAATPTIGSDAPSRARQLVATGDVLVSTVRPNLNAVAVVPPEFDGATASTGFTVLRPGEELDGRFLFHWVRSPWFIGEMVRKATGASYPAVSDRIVKESAIPAPSLPEQRRIAAILDHADALRAKRRRVLAHLDSMVQSVFNAMFGDVERSHEFGSVIRSGPTNGMYRPASDYGDGVPILRIDGFNSGDLLHGSGSWKRLRADEGEVRRYSLERGDIIVNRVNALSHLGKAALVASIDEPAVFESNMMRIRLDDQKVSRLFVLAWLETKATKEQILRRAKKAINQASINQTDVRSLLMPLPPLDLQLRFEELVEQVNDQRVAVQRALAADADLLASLQSRAFRGEL